MGQCCGPINSNKGEEYIIMVMQLPSFYLQNISYKKINELLDKIPKESFTNMNQLKEKIYPALFDNSNNNSYRAVHQSIIDEAFFKTGNNLSKNDIIFQLFSFMNHDSENSENVLYDIFFEKSGNDLDIENFKELLEKYIDICTTKLTFAVWNSCNNKELRNNFDELNSTTYTKVNQEKMVNKITGSLVKNLGSNKKISRDIFISSIRDFNLAHYQEIRNMFIHEYDIPYS